MIEHEELPIGFTMELAMHSDILKKFSDLTEAEQNAVIDGARQVKSREGMRNYVESIFRQDLHQTAKTGRDQKVY